MAKPAAPVAADPALEARVTALTAELRCLVCQNQTIADSTSDLAEDLRKQVREQLRQGASDAQVLTFMTERYGDFVLYRPPFKSSTALLWLGPAALLVLGLGALLLVLRRRARLAPDRFEADIDDDDAAPPSGAPHR
jgi:cytochrome c-type biogenesis protein CcmH